MSTHAQRMDAAQTFSVAAAHAVIRDLAEPDLRRYRVDLAGSASLGWGACLALVVGLPGWAVAPVCLVAVLALYRAAVFLHEIVHVGRRDAFRGFRTVWNLAVGVPLLLPMFMYEAHNEHHSKRHYGSGRDSEYLPFARLSPWQIVKVLVATPFAPLFGPVRFGLMAPVAWLVPPARSYVYTRASTLKLDIEYTGRPPRPGPERRSWMAQEMACCALVWAVVAGVTGGLLPVSVVLVWAVVLAGAVGLNSLRLLGAHRYLGADEEMTVVEQMLDTINYPTRSWTAELWGPVGLRLHALHHLLPGLPYHAMPAAHARLVAALPADSAYRLTESPGLLRSIAALWAAARSRGEGTPPVRLPTADSGSQP